MLQPTDPSQNIIIEGASDTEALNLTAAELNTFRNGFASIPIGRSDGSGVISIASATPNPTPNSTPVAVTFQDPTTIQSPNGTGAIVGRGAIVGTDNATLNLIGGTVSVADVTSKAGINITSTQGNLTAGTVSSRSASGGRADQHPQRRCGTNWQHRCFRFQKRGRYFDCGAGADRYRVINSSSQSGSAVSARLPGRKMLKLFRSKLAAIRAAMWKSRLGERFGPREEEPLLEAPRSAFLQTGWLDRVTDAAAKHLFVGNLHGATVGTAHSKPNTATSSTAIGSLAIAPSPAPTSSVTLNYSQVSTNCNSGESPGFRVGAKDH